jgi:hypothetical protein
MTQPKVVIARSGTDLGCVEALYVDGEFVLEKGIVSPDDVFEALGIFVKFVNYDYDWGLTGKAFPDNLTDLPLEEE